MSDAQARRARLESAAEVAEVFETMDYETYAILKRFEEAFGPGPAS